MSWSRFVSTELDDEEKLDMAMPIPMPDRPKYPYGLRICLDEATIRKLEKNGGFSLEGCCVGAVIDLRAMCEVTSVSMDKREGTNGKEEMNRRVELQITSIALENESAEEEEVEERPAFRQIAYRKKAS